MPILFIHGVNTRNSDADYFRTMAARKKMFEEYVVPVAKTKYPGFHVAEDAYWGDLGVQFRWRLESVPKSDLQSLGAPGVPAPEENRDLLALLERTAQTAASDVQALGGADSPAVAALVTERPGDLVRAVYAPQALSYEPATPNPNQALSLADQAKFRKEGEELGLLMIAVEKLARQADRDKAVLTPQAGKTVLDQIGQKTHEELQKLGPPQPATSGDVQFLGGFLKKSFEWAGAQVDNMVNAAKATVDKVKNTTARGASLLVLQAKRDDLSRKGLRFLGDVFEYLHRGRALAPSILARVVDAVKEAAATKEPLVVVTHSFGSEVLYDALTSGRLEGVNIDLWVTAGAQTSLFAEMALFEKSDKAVSPAGNALPLGKPPNVTKWINFWDAADVFSYLHAPIFGEKAVTDISVRDGANLGNAHGHYFLTVAFYERIAEELKAVINAKTAGQP